MSGDGDTNDEVDAYADIESLNIADLLSSAVYDDSIDPEAIPDFVAVTVLASDAFADGEIEPVTVLISDGFAVDEIELVSVPWMIEVTVAAAVNSGELDAIALEEEEGEELTERVTEAELMLETEAEGLLGALNDGKDVSMAEMLSVTVPLSTAVFVTEAEYEADDVNTADADIKGEALKDASED